MRLLYSRIVVKLHFYVIEDKDDTRQSAFVDRWRNYLLSCNIKRKSN